MYEYIKGKFIGINREYIVVENNGIGYKIFSSGSTMAMMPSKDENVQLFIIQIVREDFIGLYGFLTQEELQMFNSLLRINGVGPKAALSLLSILNVDNLRIAIINGEDKIIMKAPGIGKKTAQRIILELKDKLGSISSEMETDGLINSKSNSNSNFDEVKAALLSLGYSEKESIKSIKNLKLEDSLEEMIKQCLKFLMN